MQVIVKVEGNETYNKVNKAYLYNGGTITLEPQSVVSALKYVETAKSSGKYYTKDIMGYETALLKDLCGYIDGNKTPCKLDWDGAKRIATIEVGGIVWTIHSELLERFPKESAFINEIFPYVENIYYETGIPWQFLIAQVCHESAYGKSEIKDINTGERSYNLFGIKATGSSPYVEARTTEVYNGEPVKITAKFAKYSNFEQAFDAYKKVLLNNYFKHALSSPHDPVLYVKDIQSELPGESHPKYATDPNYVQKTTAIMKMWDLI